MWSIKDVDRHKSGLNMKQKRKWLAIANSVLKDSKDEGKAIRIANAKCCESFSDRVSRLIEDSMGGVNSTGLIVKRSVVNPNRFISVLDDKGEVLAVVDREDEANAKKELADFLFNNV